MTHASTRASGILLHPTSLPGPFGIGDLGPQARIFVDFLKAAGQKLWQVMPLGPTSYGDSPYQSPSAFAGNPLLIAPEELLAEGFLAEDDLADLPEFPADKVDFGAVIPWKQALLRRSFAHFQQHASKSLRQAWGEFGATQHHWLNDYALYAAIKVHNDGKPWYEWERPLAFREPEALSEIARELQNEVLFHAYTQFLFDRQWQRIKDYAHQQGISLIGDVPIFVAGDSADVWANPHLFLLDKERRPLVVAGVPPDYFSETGQLWGNPLYRWENHHQEGYAWWIARMKAMLRLVDQVRIDHFRGFAAHWEIPAGDETAVNGRWVTGPGAALFHAIERALGHLPVIAEDLGVITPDVEALRDSLGFPGMKVLQFAFGGTNEAAYLPHMFPNHAVVYTGTHDNDTTLGWWKTASDAEQAHLAKYIGHAVEEPHTELLRVALASVAEIALFPLQDVLGLGSEARMNTPSTSEGNWVWRYQVEQLTHTHASQLLEMSRLYGR